MFLAERRFFSERRSDRSNLPGIAGDQKTLREEGEMATFYAAVLSRFCRNEKNRKTLY